VIVPVLPPCCQQHRHASPIHLLHNVPDTTNPLAGVANPIDTASGSPQPQLKAPIVGDSPPLAAATSTPPIDTIMPAAVIQPSHRNAAPHPPIPQHPIVYFPAVGSVVQPPTSWRASHQVLCPAAVTVHRCMLAARSRHAPAMLGDLG
jgi:hypothetical protein